jgi:hypothetical protein
VDSLIVLLTVLTCSDRQNGHCGVGITASSAFPGTPIIDLVARAAPRAVKWIFVGTPRKTAASEDA